MVLASAPASSGLRWRPNRVNAESESCAVAARGLPSTTAISDRSFTSRRNLAYSSAPSFSRKSSICSSTSSSSSPVNVREKPVEGMVTVAEVPAALRVTWMASLIRP